LRRIYLVILVLAIIPSLISGYYVVNYFIEKEAYRQKDEQKDADSEKLKGLTSSLGVDWSVLDQHLSREYRYAKDSLSKQGKVLKEYNFTRVINVYGEDSLTRENIQSLECSPEIKEYLSLIKKYDSDYKYFYFYFRYSSSDERMMAITVSISMITIPPLLYFLVLKILIPFFRWMIQGFIDQSDETK